MMSKLKKIAGLLFLLFLLGSQLPACGGPEGTGGGTGGNGVSGRGQ